MTAKRKALLQAGRQLAREQDRQLERMAISDPTERVLEALARPERASSSSRRRSVLLAAAACLAVVVALIAFERASAPVSFAAGGEMARVGDTISVPAGSETPLSFSDGTTIRLLGGSTAQVVSADARGANVVLRQGKLVASVEHRDGARWLVDVGPYRVRVTGTRFETSWDPDTSSFRIDLWEGSVMVSGPGIEHERSVAVGEPLEMVAADPEREAAVDAPVEPPTERELAAAPASSDATAEVTDTPTDAGAAAMREPKVSPRNGGTTTVGAAAKDEPHETGDEPARDWRELAARGDYGAAHAAATNEGYERLRTLHDAATLMSLADVARLGGGGAEAHATYETVRRRFPGSAEAGQAAYLMGRAAFDGQGAYASSAHWFGVYLAEQPGGPFAREALGRLFEAKLRAGDPAGARAAAEAYLARYPQGPQATAAAAVAGR